MKPSLACLLLALGMALLAPRAAHAEPTCPKTTEAALPDVPEGLKPGTWLAKDTSITAERGSPLPSFHPAFEQQLTAARETLEIRGFIEAENRGGRAAVVLMTRAPEGFCVLNAWMSPAGEHFTRLVLVSMWRSKDSQRAVILAEASAPPTNDSKSSARAVVLGTNAQRVWTAFEATSTGLAFDPQPGTVALLGAGAPLFLDATGQFQARPAPKSAVAAEGTPPSCPKTGNKPLGKLESDPLGEDSQLKIDQWVPTDAASQFYELWDSDPLAQVAFRKLLTVGGKEVEAVGITGNDAVVVFLARASKGFCVLNSRSWAFGGNGVHASSSWWLPKNQKLAVLLFSLTFEYHHGVGPEDPREESGGVALTLDGLRVRLASKNEMTLAQASHRAGP
ncbi:MAG: hypothetical protein ACJ8AT_35965 [Hyalangium sp.]|uniref:hypothetical protein n=1 Tax=Hyalangium sp. TaxID=2028555 RepID=UPI00389B07FC